MLTASLGTPSSLSAAISGNTSSSALYFDKVISSSSLSVSIPFSEHAITAPQEVAAILAGVIISVAWSLSGNDVTVSSNVDLNGHTIRIYQ
jgi:hypothetical protein